ncbi:nitroreductase [Falsirhodobacter sp. alg1]|uniref:nitroreductase family protein n=1 Tax=Falsirhodobacter sp. alg1 TaxID=1472418 RepID=UPI000788F05E|nr:nitroreductase [Falsirhodobacter sp. alg1]
MPSPNPAATEFLNNRRSRPAKTLGAPFPDRNVLEKVLETAARTPDHGMLVPWRFVVLDPASMPRLAGLAESHAHDAGADPKKARKQFDLGNLVVMVVASPKPSEKVPELEQILSAGSLCLSLVNAAEAAGWGANWLSGWPSHNRGFMTDLGLKDHEFIAGLIHLGTERMAPAERPRPDMAEITDWVSE